MRSRVRTALLEVEAVPGIAAEKVRRLHGLARATLDGALDTEMLRALPEAEALARLEALPGIGPWTASAVLMRGCGTPDTLPLGDGISREAVGVAYGIGEDGDRRRVAGHRRRMASVPDVGDGAAAHGVAAGAGRHPELSARHADGVRVEQPVEIDQGSGSSSSRAGWPRTTTLGRSAAGSAPGFRHPPHG